MRLELAIALGGLVTAVAPAAWAGNSTASLVYARGDLAQCPEEGEVRDAVSTRLGYDPFDPRSPTRITAVITRERGGLRARVDLRNEATGAVGQRDLTSARSDCTELASAMELAISIAIDPSSLTRPVGTAPEEALPTPPPPEEHASPPLELAPPAPTTEAERMRLLAGAVASVGYGTTPGVSSGGAVFAGVRRGRLSLRVDARLGLPGTEDATPTHGVRGSLLAAGLAPCVHFGVGMGCAVVVVGRFHGEGRGVDVPMEDDVVYAAAGLRAGVELPLGAHVFVPIHAEGLVPLTHERLRLDDRVVWESAPVTVAATLGLGVTFP